MIAGTDHAPSTGHNPRQPLGHMHGRQNGTRRPCLSISTIVRLDVMEFASCTTDRLELRAVAPENLESVHDLYSDPRVWKHLPSGRHVTVQQTKDLLDRWVRDWREHGLGNWTVYSRTSSEFLGHAGCSVRRGTFWNLGFRFRPEAQGQGYATEAARAAVEAAHEVDCGLPIIASLLAHNRSSRKVIDRLGFMQQWSGPDAGNPDEQAVRLIYADRQLETEYLTCTQR